MTPDFDELVGTDIEPAERERLEHVHELLVAAGPPPEPASNVVRLPTRRTHGRLIALVAAIAIAAFALGAALVDESGRDVDFTAAMHGTSAAPDASASLVVFDVDAAGNWPMEIDVRGLPPARGGRTFELWLTHGAKLEALCGGFLTDENGAASVPMNAPYPFDEEVGWVIVEKGTTTPLLTT